MIPEIEHMHVETDRLVIRPYTNNDLLEAHRLMQDKELFTFLHMDVMPLDEYKELFDWLIGSYDTPFDKTFKYSFAIMYKNTGKMVGWCGVGALDFMPLEKEIYYLIGREYWGKRYASEAAAAALIDYCFQVIQLPRIVAKVDPANAPSKRILERNGFEFQYTLTGLTGEFSDCNGELYYSLERRQ